MNKLGKLLICEVISVKYIIHTAPSLWSGRRDSNSRQPAWKAGTLATELRPRHFM